MITLECIFLFSDQCILLSLTVFHTLYFAMTRNMSRFELYHGPFSTDGNIKC